MFNIVKYTSYVLVLIGALNWGLIGFFNFDLVAAIFGEMTTASKFVYDVIGLSALVSLVTTYICHADCY
ncbi:MAG: DUF378 domain-containing protein [Candidatus Gastranaerophilaceae bacterium]